MKKILKLFCVMLFTFMFFSTCVYATADERILIRHLEIENLDRPVLNGKLDSEVTITRTSNAHVREIVWYKNGSRFYGDTFDEYATYTCRIYINIDEGYRFAHNTGFYCDNTTEKISFAVMGDHYFIDIPFVLQPPVVYYPAKMYFTGISIPRHNNLPDYQGASQHPDFYEVQRIEWYRDNVLMNSNEAYIGGEYKCRVYFTLKNGFTLKPGIIISIGGTQGEIVQTKDYIYAEFKYILEYKESEALVSVTNLNFKTLPSFGTKTSNVQVVSTDRKRYYEIDEIVWYKDSKLYYDEYFSAGNYTCRIYIEFVNGGFPNTIINSYTGENLLPKKMSKQADRWYTERTFKIGEPYIKTFQFEDLNVPEYGGIQDNKISSKEPGMYTPSMVYWYKNDKYMSNVDTYSEGTYKCKFTITVNNECTIADDANAKIGNVYGTVSRDYNTVTVEAYYEVKKPTATWSNASDWAKPELEEALNNALIPAALKGKDYTQSITRAEFAAVAVKLYERLAYRLATPVSENPFEDTSDEEILKAYALGITNGTSATTFSPDALITRQEMATMMVRALKKVGVDTSVNLSAVSKFNDHAQIDSWALDGVYYMSNLGIIKGVGNNTFNVHGNATREEALAISIRSVKKLK